MERETNEEIVEVDHFLETVLNSSVMMETVSYLRLLGKENFTIRDLKQTLHELWFRFYGRKEASRILDSCGFEHVFVGETDRRRKKVLGFHSWIQFYLLERIRQVNYFGHLKKTKKPHLLMLKFNWQDDAKQIGSMFIGTSPEFDLALYTAVYLMGWSKLPVEVAGMRFSVRCFGINANKSIGTCYPDLI